jgi:hypothetical protein
MAEIPVLPGFPADAPENLACASAAGANRGNGNLIGGREDGADGVRQEGNAVGIVRAADPSGNNEAPHQQDPRRGRSASKLRIRAIADACEVAVENIVANGNGEGNGNRNYNGNDQGAAVDELAGENVNGNGNGNGNQAIVQQYMHGDVEEDEEEIGEGDIAGLDELLGPVIVADPAPAPAPALAPAPAPAPHPAPALAPPQQFKLYATGDEPRNLAVDCLICLPNVRGEHPHFASMSNFVKHCNRYHVTDHALQIQSLLRCPRCHIHTNGQRGLNRHQTACNPPEGAREVGDVAAEVEVAAAEGGQQEQEVIERATDVQLQALFRGGLYNVHAAWELPLYEIVMSVLKGMLSEEMEECYDSTLAFFLIPGLVVFCNSFHKCCPGVPRAVDLLRRIVASTPENLGKSLADLVVAEAVGVYELHRHWNRREEREERGPQSRQVTKALARAEKFGRNGRFAPAAAILRRLEPLLTGQEAGEELRLSSEERAAAVLNLHPPFRSEDLDTIPPLQPGVEEPESSLICSKDVLQGIKGLRKDSAHGGSGWSNNSIRWLRVRSLKQDGDNAGEIGGALAEVFNRLHSGGMPTEVRSMWTRTRLVLLPKPGQQGAVRPLGLRDSFYRLGMRLLLVQCKDDLATHLGPAGQLAVGIPGGCQIGAQAMQMCYDRICEGSDGSAEESAGILLIDVKNAFNTLSVRQIYEQLLVICPGLARVFRFMYSEPSDLYGNEGELLGRRCIGVTQGDPLSTALCALAMLKPMAKCLAIAEEEKAKVVAVGGKSLAPVQVGFADDVSIGGSLGVMARVAPQVQGAFTPAGMTIAETKCMLAGARTSELSPEHRPMGFQIREGVKVLGVPVGSEEYKREFMDKCSAEMKIPHSALQRVSCHLAFLLISMVFNALPTYLLQSVHPSITRAFCVQFDSDINKCLGAILGMCSTDPSFVTLRGLSLAQGGLGIACKDGLIARGAFDVAQARSHEFITAFMPPLMSIDTRCYSQQPWVKSGIGEPGFADTIEIDDAERVILMEGYVHDEVKAVVKAVRGRVDQAKRVAFELELEQSDHPADREKRAWFLSGAHKDASRWLHDQLSFAFGTKYITSEGFRHAIRLRCLQGLEDPEGRRLGRCGCCAANERPRNHQNEGSLTHAISCHGTNLATQRHDKLRDILGFMLRGRVGKGEEGEPKIISVSMEESFGDGVTPINELSVRMDLVVRCTNGIYLVDLAVVNPACLRWLRKTGPVVPFAAAKARAAEKLRVLKERVPLLNLARTVKFVPFVVEATGRLGPGALALLEALQVPGEIRRMFSRDVSVHLSRFNGMMLSKVRKATLGAPSGQLGV